MEYTNHQPTSIQDLISYSQGQIVKLPDFQKGNLFMRVYVALLCCL